MTGRSVPPALRARCLRDPDRPENRSEETTVESALKVRANDTATAALANGMTLDMAAVIDEFSDDAEAITRLEQVAAENPQGPRQVSLGMPNLLPIETGTPGSGSR
ncbi:hypothetical protein [Arthrobacter sp. D2-10]